MLESKGKEIIGYAFNFLIVFGLIFLTTYGFRPSKNYSAELSGTETEISENLKEIVAHLSLNIGNRSYADYKQLNQAADYVSSKFRMFGYNIEYQTYEIRGVSFKNIIATDSTFDSNAPAVIIAAHYDTCRNPGADDNASGIAGMLELARLMKGSDRSRNYKFIAFVNEEPPFFMTENMGSRVYAREAVKKGEKIKAAIVLEMIGVYKDSFSSQKYFPIMGLFYPNKGNFIAGVGNFSSRKVLKKFSRHYKENGAVPLETVVAPVFLPGIGWSDHWSFWKEGYPAIMLTDTAFLRNEYYHSKEDLPHTLDYKRMALVVNNLKVALDKFSD